MGKAVDTSGSGASARRFSGLRLLGFSSLAIPLAGAGLPLAVYLPPIFVAEYGLSLTTIGVIFLIGRLWDAVTDPLAGSLSDRTRSRFGRRRPWIAAGGLIFFISAALLFFPPVHVTPLYLLVTLFIFYIGWTAIQIPFSAWGGELSSDYHERTRIVTYQQVAAAAGLMLALVLPTLADQFAPGDNKLKVTLMGGLVLVTLLPGIALSLLSVPDPRTDQVEIQAERLSLKQVVQAIAGEPLLLRVLASDFAVTLAQSIRGSLIVFFVASYMGRPEWASGLFLFQFVFGILAGPIWMRIGMRFGKHRTAFAGEIVQVVINLGLLLVTPERFGLLLALTLAQGLSQGSGNLMLRSMVADVADKQRLRTGEDRTGLYYSVFSLAGKAATAAAVGIALPLVSALGFDPRAAEQSASAHVGLLLVFALGPALGHIVSALLVYRFPLGQAEHAEIRRELSARTPPPQPAE